MYSPEQENTDVVYNSKKELNAEELQKLKEQDKRIVCEFKAKKLEDEAQKNWDLFYKRNETRFFKDRRWTTREFKELLADENSTKKILLEVGCGVGNFIFPLIEESVNNYFFLACDFSPRAVEFVKQNPLYDESKVKAFQCDITSANIHNVIQAETVDVVTLIFVLSAINPTKFQKVVQNLSTITKPGGIVLFRDYGIYDMAQLRFKPGHKISTNFYMRQDGTTTYYFETAEIESIFTENGFVVESNAYVHRRTINKKQEIDVPRIFLQGKFRKMLNSL